LARAPDGFFYPGRKLSTEDWDSTAAGVVASYLSCWILFLT
jgi:hypothetical protein